MGGMPTWSVGTDESMDALMHGAATGIEAAMDSGAVALASWGTPRQARAPRRRVRKCAVTCVSKCEDRSDVSGQEDDDTSSEDGWAYVSEREKYPLVDPRGTRPAPRRVRAPQNAPNPCPIGTGWSAQKASALTPDT